MTEIDDAGNERRAALSHADVLTRLAADAGLGGYSRLEVAEALARGGDPRGMDLLAAMAADPALGGYVRRRAAGALAKIAGPADGLSGRPA